MKAHDLLARITSSPNILAGKPVIKGTRLSVEFVLSLLANGSSTTEIISEYDGLCTEDIRACLLFAANSLADTSFMPLVAQSP